MSSDDVMFLFDVIILVYGFFGIFSAFQMKKTGVPAAMLVTKEELPKIKHPEKFCRTMFGPTVILGVMAFLYSGVDMLNRFLMKFPFVDILGVLCFLMVCAWYVKEMRRAKENN